MRSRELYILNVKILLKKKCRRMETVCIPRERYEYLLKCERLVDMEFEEKFSEEFIAEVKESEEAYRRGEYNEVKKREEREKLFESL